VSRLTATVDTHAYEADVIPHVADQLMWTHTHRFDRRATLSYGLALLRSRYKPTECSHDKGKVTDGGAGKLDAGVRPDRLNPKPERAGPYPEAQYDQKNQGSSANALREIAIANAPYWIVF
jgi:hypothetical protein